jgi:hypothetical protein
VRSPGSQHEEITHMHGFSDPAGSDDDSTITPPSMLPSAEPQHVGTPTLPISRLNSRPARTPEPTLRCALTGRQRMDGAIAIR